MRPALLTVLALVAFAANSLFCRAALGAHAIDAGSFTFVRLASGALTLALVLRLRRAPGRAARNLASSAALFVYAIAFSVAYLRLPTGTGALVLFGFVQLTMITAALRAGERPRPAVWLAMAVAVAGLVGLTLPGLGAPDPFAAALMALAGIAWGVYSLRGRGATDPLAVTATNFAWALPLAVVAFAIAGATGARVTLRGASLAFASGAIASGLGYAIWYAALRHLTATRAAVAQLAVPVIAAAAGAVVLGETVTARLIVSGTAILGGVAFVVTRR